MFFKFCFKTEMKLTRPNFIVSCSSPSGLSYPVLLPVPEVQGHKQVIILQRDESELSNTTIRKS